MFHELLVGNRLSRRIADAGLVSYSRRRVAALDAMNVPMVQHETLFDLIGRARTTQFGRDHAFDRIRTVEDYRRLVPVRDYESFWKTYWESAFPKFEGVTWPDPIPYFALSSGTTSGTTKYIPISRDMVRSNRTTAFTTIAFFRNAFPKVDLFGGRFFFLGGNTELRTESNGSRSGDLSAIAAIEVAGVARPYTFPPLELAAISDWQIKVTRLAEASAKLPITAISGVPSWVLFLFERMKQVTGKSRIGDIWPRLRLIVHGGTSFEPYRDVFRRELGDEVHFVEVYPASEGFIATADPRHGFLRIVPDHGVYFEFIPMDQLENGKLKTDRPVRHSLAEVEVGVPYAVAVTTCAGLWSYILGDTVAFERRDPPLIRFTGRTKYYLSAFGEHLIAEECEKAIAVAAVGTGARVNEWHVGPVFPTDPKQPGHHRYLVEFQTAPDSLADFARRVDQELSRLNEDYEAHRRGDLTMLAPEVTAVRVDGFLQWMLAHGKRPPQHKVPRMDNTGEQTKGIEQWLRAHGWMAT